MSQGTHQLHLTLFNNILNGFNKETVTANYNFKSGIFRDII